MIKFVSDLRRSVVSSTNKTHRHDIAEILLKVAINTITLSNVFLFKILKLKICDFTSDKQIFSAKLIKLDLKCVAGILVD